MHFGAFQEQGINQAVSRRLNLTGGAAVPTVMPELSIGMILENDRPEWGYLKQEIPFARTVAAAASGAGAYSGCEIWNPTGSGLIVVLKLITISAQSAGGVRAGVSLSTAVPSGTAIVGVSRDTRYGSAASIPNSRVIVTSTNTYTSPASLPNLIGTAALERLDYDEPIILGPGGTFYVIGDTANTALSRVNFSWTERKAQPGELG